MLGESWKSALWFGVCREGEQPPGSCSCERVLVSAFALMGQKLFPKFAIFGRHPSKNRMFN